MEKLPHERLREAEGFGDICFYFDYDGDEEYEAYSKIADEIEHYYIPRPRFEDGEPVQFGDEFIMDRYMREPETLTHFGIFSKELLDDWEQYHGVAPVYEMNFCRPNCEDGKIPIIKRTTKVLDADGVEIKVGDTVWNIHGYDSSECALAYKYGAPIKVVRFNEYRQGFVICEGEDGKTIDFPSDWLTHREPDSLEKLRDDMMDASLPYDVQTVSGWVDRLTHQIAIMERDA